MNTDWSGEVEKATPRRHSPPISARHPNHAIIRFEAKMNFSVSAHVIEFCFVFGTAFSVSSSLSSTSSPSFFPLFHQKQRNLAAFASHSPVLPGLRWEQSTIQFISGVLSCDEQKGFCGRKGILFCQSCLHIREVCFLSPRKLTFEIHWRGKYLEEEQGSRTLSIDRWYEKKKITFKKRTLYLHIKNSKWVL